MSVTLRVSDPVKLVVLLWALVNDTVVVDDMELDSVGVALDSEPESEGVSDSEEHVRLRETVEENVVHDLVSESVTERVGVDDEVMEPLGLGDRVDLVRLTETVGEALWLKDLDAVAD